MEYADIEAGKYKERVACRALQLQKEEIAEYLKNTELVLEVERVPRILCGSLFDECNMKKGFYLQTAHSPIDPAASYLLLKSSSSLGVPAALVLTYEYFTHGELLKRAGIKESEYQSSYNKVGSIIHLNLKDETLQHKQIISKVLFDKIKDCTAVVRKASNITGVFRNIQIEHLQGVPCYKTVQRENGLRFSIDYDKVYWNSKLQIERKRLCSLIKPGDTFCDLFCGVGPFAILALLKGATVWANDLNPDSIANFKESMLLNRKVLGVRPSTRWNEDLEDRIHLYNMDAGDFLKHVSTTENGSTTSPRRFSHYVLNLPELTLQYLKCVVDLEQTQKQDGCFMVHAYFFVHSGESAKEKVEEVMGRSIECVCRMVKKVSPSKEMWLVSFPLV